jgi:hypothetical protein
MNQVQTTNFIEPNDRQNNKHSEKTCSHLTAEVKQVEDYQQSVLENEQEQ